MICERKFTRNSPGFITYCHPLHSPSYCIIFYYSISLYHILEHGVIYYIPDHRPLGVSYHISCCPPLGQTSGQS